MKRDRRKPFPRRKVRLVGTIPTRVSIVGSGAVGSTLAVALVEKGYTIVSIINRSGRSALSLAREVHCMRVSASPADIPSDTEIIVFAVADDALGDVIRETGKRIRLHRLLALHTSGVHSLDVLQPLKSRGAIVGSMHPIQSFPKSKSLRERVKSLRGIHFGVEGDAKGIEMIQGIVRTLGGQSILVPKGLKSLYHAACVFSSNYVVTLLNAARESVRPIGFENQWREMILPLFTTTVENAMKASPEQALTGPIARNDLATIELHLEALQRSAPQLVPLYAAMGVETARLARTSGKLTSDQFQSVVALMRGHVKHFVKTGPRKKEKR
jgi:predicted short-subunit dehydrogenase-like oxidoreductase (DUF2520 family)